MIRRDDRDSFLDELVEFNSKLSHERKGDVRRCEARYKFSYDAGEYLEHRYDVVELPSESFISSFVEREYKKGVRR